MTQSTMADCVVLPWSIFPTDELRPMSVRSFGKTDRGRARKSNEDQFLIASLRRTLNVQQSSLATKGADYSQHRAHVFVVADGMSDRQGGEVASELAIAAIESFLLDSLKQFVSLQPADDQEVLKEFQTALVQADARLFAEGTRHSELQGMATTLTMALVYESRAYVAHAGNSRCYLFSHGNLQRVTRDALMADADRPEAPPAKNGAPSSLRHIITNALGGGRPGVEPEVHQLDLQQHDVLLFCTEGLTDMVADEQIAAILNQEEQPRQACEKLIAAANAAGGRDNITAIVARFQDAT